MPAGLGPRARVRRTGSALLTALTFAITGLAVPSAGRSAPGSVNFNDRSAWVYRDAVIDSSLISKAQKWGIRIIYIDPTSSNAVQERDAIVGAGIIAGAYFSPSWQSGMSGTQFADWASQLTNALLPKVGVEAPPVMLDLEVGSNLGWRIQDLNRWRAHQPRRPTAYTDAPFQGGNIPYSLLVKYGIPFYVQLYYGDMTPADGPRAVLEAVRWGMPGDMVHPFYDGALYRPTLQDQFDGAQFTLERMPS